MTIPEATGASPSVRASGELDDGPPGLARDGDLPTLLRAARQRCVRGHRIDRVCYLLAGALVASGCVHLGVQVLVGGPGNGSASLREPADFGLAFGLALLAVTFASTFLRLSERARRWWLSLFAAACTAEVAAMSMQVDRGVPLFFNTATPFDAWLAYLSAAGGALIVVTALVLAGAALRRAPAVPLAMRIAVVTGFVSFLVAALVGVVMIVEGSPFARVGAQAAAYDAAVVLVPAHAAAMPGILLPVLGWAAGFTGWGERRGARTLGLACTGYLVCAGAVVAQTLLGVGPLAATVAIAGAVGLLAATLAVAQAVLPRRARRRNPDRTGRTAIGGAQGAHRAFLIATCVALVLAAVGDEAPGYDGPGPLIYLAFAALVALVRGRYTPLLATAMSLLFLYGGLAQTYVVARLLDPADRLEFTATWLQLGAFVAAATCAATAVLLAPDSPPTRASPRWSDR